MCVKVWVCAQEYSTCGGQNSVSDPLTLEMLVTELPDLGSGNETWILYKGSTGSNHRAISLDLFEVIVCLLVL